MVCGDCADNVKQGDGYGRHMGNVVGVLILTGKTEKGSSLPLARFG
jgi:hypothetical protein